MSVSKIGYETNGPNPQWPLIHGFDHADFLQLKQKKNLFKNDQYYV